MLGVESGKKCGKRGSMDLLIDLQQQTLSAVDTLVDIHRELLEIKKAKLEVQRKQLVMEKAKLAAKGWFQDENGNWISIVTAVGEE